jgi:hexosaminidase
MMIDVARHFHDAATLKRVIEALAFYKLNRLHLHLSDDEGWRLEIAGLPELTEIGSRRGHTRDERDRLYPSLGSGPDPDISPGSGYFDRATFIDLLRFATDRHIEVIPEFDLPGHSRAAIRSMEERHRRLTAENSPEASTYRLIHPGDTSRYRSVQHWDDNVVDVCLPSTLAFVERVIDATVALYREAGAPLSTIHVGGDEVPPGVWMASPACGAGVETPDPEALKEAFFSRVYEILERHGLAMSGWEEMALHHGRDNTRTPSEALRGKQVRAYAWNSVWGWGGEDHAYRLANAGYDVVMSAATDLYFDLSYDKDPEEPGYYWAAFVDTYAPFAFQPFDIYRAARRDRMGHPLDPVGVAQSRERLSPEGRGHILGLQGQLWSERARDRGELEYLLFPKLLGLAERAWAPQPAWEQGPLDLAEALRGTAWNAFANRLGQRELPRLDHLAGGFAYRIPPPGVAEIDGTLQANTAFPGLTIRYSSDGTEPDAEDPRYEGPLPTDRRVRFRAFDTRGRGSRSAALVP